MKYIASLGLKLIGPTTLDRLTDVLKWLYLPNSDVVILTTSCQKLNLVCELWANGNRFYRVKVAKHAESI